MSKDRLKSAAIRGIRTFVAAFVAIEPVQALIGWASGSQALDTSAVRAAFVAGIAAFIAAFWRAVIDPLPLPTLTDKTPTA